MKYVLIAIVVLIVAGAGGAWWYTRDKEAAAAAEANAPKTAKVERQNLRVTVEATGAVSSNQDVDIKCMASGEITTLPYNDVSAQVKPGELLVKVDPKLENQSLESAQAVVNGDKAHIEEAKVNLDIATKSLVTTRMRDEAALLSAKAAYADADAKAKRTKDLCDQKLDSQEDLDTANDAAAQAQANVMTAQAAMEELQQLALQIDTHQQQIAEMNAQLQQDLAKFATANQNLEYCTVTAPDATNPKDPPKWYISAMGTNVTIGYLVQSGSSGFSSGTTVMTLSDLSHIYVLATVDESDIGTLLLHFNAGQQLPVDLTADAYKDMKFHGKVVRIATKGVNTSNVVTFEVKIEVTSPNRDLLRPIMTTNVEIITGEKDNALVVPAEAVLLDGDKAATESADTQVAAADPAAKGGANARAARKKHPNADRARIDGSPLPATVEVLKPDGTTETRNVTVGLTDGVSYEVISGLNEGENILLGKAGINSRWHGADRGGGRGLAGGMRG